MGVDGVGTNRCALNVVNTDRGLTPYSVVHAPPIPCIWTSNKLSCIQDDWLNTSQAPPLNMKGEEQFHPCPIFGPLTGFLRSKIIGLLLFKPRL
jgi:hypothetical protein